MTTTPVLPIFGYIGPRGQMRQVRWMEEDAPVCRVSDALAAIAATQSAAPTPAGCQNCDGSSDVHGLDGEWRGTCHCEAGKGQPAASIAPAQPTDVERLDFLDSKGVGWIARESVTGRGYRVHQDREGLHNTARAAIDAAIAASKGAA